DVTTDIVVRASAPKELALSLGGVTTLTEGSTVNLTGSFSVPGAPTAHTVVVNWGDGSAPETFSLAAGTNAFSRPHTYVDDNPTATSTDVNPITVTVSDGGSTVLATSASTTLTVRNAAPSSVALQLEGAPGATVQEGDRVTLRGQFTDPG